MASCSLCRSLGKTKLQYNHILATEHANTHFLHLKMIDDGIEMNKIFYKCFPDFSTITDNGQIGPENSCPRDLVALCHSIFTRKSLMESVLSHIICEKCDAEIKITDRRKCLTPNVLIEHACGHLPFSIYECRHCDRVFKSKENISFHMVTNHQLRTAVGQYRGKADDFVVEISGMIKACFGGRKKSVHSYGVTIRSVNIRKVRRCTRGSHLTIGRRLHCYRLIRKRIDRNGKVQCRLCSKGISVKNGNGVTSDRLMQHAFLHVRKKLYHCKKCSDSFVNRSNMFNHLKKEHALSFNETYYQCLADLFHSEIVRVLRQCYGEGDEGDEEDALVEDSMSVKCESNESTSATRLRSRLTTERQTLCNQLVRENSDRKKEKLPCRLCNKRISTKGIRSGKAMNHALVHLEKPMYRCKICSEMSNTRSNIGLHVTRKHAQPMANNYDCLADQFHVEIVEILRKCYNNGITNEAKPFKSRARAEASVRSRLNGSKLTVARQLFCYRLIKKFVNSDGKVDCRLCKKRPVAKRGEHNVCSPALTHAMVHLKKPIYRCMVCFEMCPYDSFMKNHLKTAHALPLAKNYECLADECHSEILAKLSECFGEM